MPTLREPGGGGAQGLSAQVVIVIGVVEVAYLPKADMEFHRVYVVGCKSWF